METRYTVRQTMEKVGVKPYVLRYWEDELELNIHRNEMGHRYYTGYDIQVLMNIKELKNRGLQLRAIRDLIPKMQLTEMEEEERKVIAIAEHAGEEKTKAIQEEESCLSEEKLVEFQSILERLIAQEMKSKSEEEERCRSLDLAIRRQQLARREAAAAVQKKENTGKRIHKYAVTGKRI